MAVVAAAGWLGLAGTVRAQSPEPSPSPEGRSRGARLALFLAGGATGLVAHESGHLALDAAFGAGVNVHHVDFGGIPFFAVSPSEPVTPRQRFAITSAGFFVQHAGSEWLLSRHPRLREEHAPFAKGLLAFNVLASVAYGGAALARTGPVERDTNGMAESLRVAEPWVGLMVLTPAALDTWRYTHPDAAWARWTSRAVKVALVALVIRPQGGPALR